MPANHELKRELEAAVDEVIAEKVTAVTRCNEGWRNATRTFTEAEEHLVIRGLMAIRPHVLNTERLVIDGILRDGWNR